MHYGDNDRRPGRDLVCAPTIDEHVEVFLRVDGRMLIVKRQRCRTRKAREDFVEMLLGPAVAPVLPVGLVVPRV